MCFCSRCRDPPRETKPWTGTSSAYQREPGGTHARPAVGHCLGDTFPLHRLGSMLLHHLRRPLVSLNRCISSPLPRLAASYSRRYQACPGPLAYSQRHVYTKYQLLVLGSRRTSLDNSYFVCSDTEPVKPLGPHISGTHLDTRFKLLMHIIICDFSLKCISQESHLTPAPTSKKVQGL